MASIWNLPVIFVCENNLYGVSTRITDVLPVKNGADRAVAYGIPGVVVDGNDVLVYKVAEEAVKRAREDKGPTLIECKTYRYRGHSRFDPALYQPKDEKEEWLKKDPLLCFKRYLIDNKIASEDEIKSIEKEVGVVMEEAVRFAKASPEPAAYSAAKYTYV